MGGLPVGPRRVKRRKYPDSWVRVAQSPSLGESVVVSRPKAWGAMVHPSLAGVPIGIFVKVVPSTFEISA
ncbi:hypothetical protein B296_00055027 [Ensete ventricosum]|uniref:Uncharacterized protein n=1 Tax=Ensete ventricosum TaxID=4639 RepID=A0A426X1A9_ENSVE|nr:hypothetical protein B296_00055027 [Ensete ventricosum]